MYRSARALPKNGFRPDGAAGAIDDGPSLQQRIAKADYDARLEAERARSRKAGQPPKARAPVNMLVCKDVPARLGPILNSLGLRPSKRSGRWWIIVDDNRPGARETRIRLDDHADLYKLSAEWRPLRRRKPRVRLSRRRDKTSP